MALPRQLSGRRGFMTVAKVPRTFLKPTSARQKRIRCISRTMAVQFLEDTSTFQTLALFLKTTLLTSIEDAGKSGAMSEAYSPIRMAIIEPAGKTSHPHSRWTWACLLTSKESTAYCANTSSGTARTCICINEHRHSHIIPGHCMRHFVMDLGEVARQSSRSATAIPI